MRYKLLFCSFFTVLAVSCNSIEANMNKTVNDFANLECRAILLRQQRFALANQIRFTEDTLLHTTNRQDTARLQSNLKAFVNQKEGLLQNSLSMADSIKRLLDSLMKNELKDEKQKSLFNQLLKTALEKRGCR